MGGAVKSHMQIIFNSIFSHLYCDVTFFLVHPNFISHVKLCVFVNKYQIFGLG